MRSLLKLIPLPWKLGAIAALLAAAIATGAYIARTIYDRGHDDAIATINRGNAHKGRITRQAVDSVDACHDRCGRWDQSRGVCIAQPVCHR